jgi:hypothetical protein
LTVLYEDKRITCDDDGITIHDYYFPRGDKRIAYRDIRSFDQRKLGLLTGKWRIWGTGHPGYWYHLDPKRPSKTKAVVIDKGDSVKAVITPDDPDAVLHILEDKLGRGGGSS